MKTLGIMLSHLGTSQLAFYAINNANKTLLENGQDVLIFYELPAPSCVNLECGLMQTQEAWNFDGPLIAPNLNLASKLIGFPGTKQKFFYVWDLEWLRIPNKDFVTLSTIYRSPLLKLIARSSEHAKLINKAWNVDIAGIVPNYNIHAMLELING